MLPADPPRLPVLEPAKEPPLCARDVFHPGIVAAAVVFQVERIEEVGFPGDFDRPQVEADVGLEPGFTAEGAAPGQRGDVRGGGVPPGSAPGRGEAEQPGERDPQCRFHSMTFPRVRGAFPRAGPPMTMSPFSVASAMAAPPPPTRASSRVAVPSRTAAGSPG